MRRIEIRAKTVAFFTIVVPAISLVISCFVSTVLSWDVISVEGEADSGVIAIIIIGLVSAGLVVLALLIFGIDYVLDWFRDDPTWVIGGQPKIPKMVARDSK